MISDWRNDLAPALRDVVKCKPMPEWTRPMLATLSGEQFSSPDWIYERKLDGERCLVFRRKSRLHILSRNRQDLNDTYPELVEALTTQSAQRYIADGEIVAFDGRLTSFSRLQGRIGIKDPDEARTSGIKVFLYLFDVLYFDAYDTTALPLRSRKRLLLRHFDFSGPLRFTRHRNERGEALYDEACRKGWEGLIAKRADSRYVHSRSRDWLKFKCVNRQELVIGGYTDPKGSRHGFGALLLGFYRDKKLRYAGKVGTGFDDEMLRTLSRRLLALQRESCPFAERPDDKESGMHWVRPKLVAEIGFTEWTRDGRLRHPRFLGLRDDKPAARVVREQPD